MASTTPRGISAAISIGMVLVPIKAYGSVRDHGISFNMIHAACGCRVKQGYTCPTCNDVAVERSEMGKGIAVGKDQILQVTDEELESLPLRTTKAIEVIKFVDADAIDPVMYERLDWIGPDDKLKTGQKAFVLLREAMVRSNKIAIAKTARSGKEMLCVIRPRGKAMEMARLYWQEQVVDIDLIEAGIDDLALSDQESALADQLVATMTGVAAEVLATETDGYKAALDQLIDAKLEGREMPTQIQPAAAPANDLMAMLKASLAAA